MRDGPFATEGRHKCWQCEKVFDADKLLGIEDLTQRIEPGQPFPSGECPECGFLCYPIKTRRRRIEPPSVPTSFVPPSSPEREKEWQHGMTTPFSS